jgi:Protein of unknown function (DUF1488)
MASYIGRRKFLARLGGCVAARRSQRATSKDFPSRNSVRLTGRFALPWQWSPAPPIFGHRSPEENESPKMPLTRLNDSAFDAQLEGVYFGMWNGSSPVRCLVTHEALTDKAQGSGQAESLDIFHEYRSELENLASAKYDAGQIKSDGLVVVDSADLNPEQFQQGLA